MNIGETAHGVNFYFLVDGQFFLYRRVLVFCLTFNVIKCLKCNKYQNQEKNETSVLKSGFLVLFPKICKKYGNSDEVFEEIIISAIII